MGHEGRTWTALRPTDVTEHASTSRAPTAQVEGRGDFLTPHAQQLPRRLLPWQPPCRLPIFTNIGDQSLLPGGFQPRESAADPELLPVWLCQAQPFPLASCAFCLCRGAGHWPSLGLPDLFPAHLQAGLPAEPAGVVASWAFTLHYHFPSVFSQMRFCSPGRSQLLQI